MDIEVLKNDLTPRQLLVQGAMNALGSKCKDIITLFYLRGFNIEEITEYLGYSSKDVVKSQKSRCLKTLKERIKTSPNG